MHKQGLSTLITVISTAHARIKSLAELVYFKIKPYYFYS